MMDHPFMDDLEVLPLPDWATLVVERLANPKEMSVDIDPAGMGSAILRQLIPQRGHREARRSSA
jgi:hypothetical protein